MEQWKKMSEMLRGENFGRRDRNWEMGVSYWKRRGNLKIGEVGLVIKLMGGFGWL